MTSQLPRQSIARRSSHRRQYQFADRSAGHRQQSASGSQCSQRDRPARTSFQGGNGRAVRVHLYQPAGHACCCNGVCLHRLSWGRCIQKWLPVPRPRHSTGSPAKASLIAHSSSEISPRSSGSSLSASATPAAAQEAQAALPSRCLDHPPAAEICQPRLVD